MGSNQNNNNGPGWKRVDGLDARFRNAQMAKHQEDMRRQAEISEIKKREERKIKAAEETAVNTAMTNEQLKIIIDNQNQYIKVLEGQLEISQSQLQAMKKLFVSLEDGVAVEKELSELIQSQIDATHPLWDYVKDKGGDIAVNSIVLGTPVLYNAFKAYLTSKGILIP